MPMMGRDWSQPGVASLYSNIRKNGYQILYLTARAIGQVFKFTLKHYLNTSTLESIDKRFFEFNYTRWIFITSWTCYFVT